MSLDDVLDYFSPANSHWRSGWKKFLVLFGVTGGFVGYLPVAPGTWGSLVGVGIVIAVRHFSLLPYIALCIIGTLLGVWLCAVARHVFKLEDPQRAVVDEIVGVMITMIGMPVTPYWLLAGFILFRIFDVMKPFPANIADERIKSGWGVMLDDVIAGIYGCIVLHLMFRAHI